jgi:hypothetical protein
VVPLVPLPPPLLSEPPQAMASATPDKPMHTNPKILILGMNAPPNSSCDLPHEIGLIPPKCQVLHFRRRVRSNGALGSG